MSVQFDLARGLRAQIAALGAALAGNAGQGVSAIPAEHVVTRDMQYDATLWHSWRDELAPGWIVAIGKEVTAGPSEGTNVRNDVIYSFYLCGIDRSDERYNEYRSEVWSDRAQAIRRYLHMQNLQGLTAGSIKATLVWTPETAMYNEQLRKLYHIVNVVIPVMVMIREPKDSSGAG